MSSRPKIGLLQGTAYLTDHGEPIAMVDDRHTTAAAAHGHASTEAAVLSGWCRIRCTGEQDEYGLYDDVYCLVVSRPLTTGQVATLLACWGRDRWSGLLRVDYLTRDGVQGYASGTYRRSEASLRAIVEEAIDAAS